MEGVLSQVTVSLSVPALVRPSETLRLVCKVHGAAITDSSKIWAEDFIRQFSGNRLEFLAHINYNEGKAFNPSLQSRLSLSRDTAKNEAYLDFTAMKSEDTAMYYCVKDTVFNEGCHQFTLVGK
ncbi:hypothetical protein GDO86_001593 [Hymenochirus boettgeri]|uniref:Ig-like domain-containing protein n=1 Tax=Hymenochirus boettgeri TaxID=247094 RepID=A0A8T2KIZ8_9PIPI|nr:hypothetical protein GDO86_001593 [Hymenochirus boettgeri]